MESYFSLSFEIQLSISGRMQISNIILVQVFLFLFFLIWLEFH